MRRFLVGAVLSMMVSVGNASMGIQNNNPGNIIKTGISWQGEVECDSRFECFESPKDGIRALAKNLLSSYNKHGTRTPKEMLHRWSPPHENDTNNLIGIFHEKTGIGPEEDLALEDNDRLVLAMNAIIIQENGHNPYGEMLRDVVYTLRTEKEVIPIYGATEKESGSCVPPQEEYKEDIFSLYAYPPDNNEKQPKPTNPQKELPFITKDPSRRFLAFL